MIVILNNGTRIKISNEMVQAIGKNILSEKGANKWQVELSSSTNTMRIFNLQDISVICEENDIVDFGIQS